MAIKIKNKTSTREAAKEPDQIYTATERAFNYLETNRLRLAVTLGSIVAVILLATLIVKGTQSSAREAGSEVTAVALLLRAPVGEGLAELYEGTTFETYRAQAEAMREAMTEDAQEAPAGQLLDAIAAVQLGDMGTARAQFAAAAESEDRWLALVARQGLAAANVSIGNSEGAQAQLDGLAQDYSNEFVQVFAMVEQARLSEASGDLEEALRSYRAVENLPGAAIAGHRAELLQVVTGFVPTPEVTEEQTELDGASEEGTADTTEATNE